MFSFLCEETFDDEAVASAIAEGKDAVIKALRTKNLFPIGLYAKEIAAGVTDMYESGNDQSVELVFDDHDLMKKELEEPAAEDDIEDEVVEIDDLIEDDSPVPDYDDKSEIKNITYSLKIDNGSSNSKDED
jgi:hypothetical protein